MNPKRHKSPRFLGVVITVVTVLVVGACSDKTDSSGEASPAEPPLVTVPAEVSTSVTVSASTLPPATTTEPVPTTSPTAPVPLDESTSTTGVEPDWPSILETLLDESWRLYTEPTDDPTRVSAIIWEGCDCYPNRVSRMQQLFADGQHVATAAPEIVDVVIATQDEGFTILTVTLATPEFIDIADAAGTVVQHIEAAPPGFYERVSVTLFPNGPNESWRIQAYIALTSVPIESVS